MSSQYGEHEFILDYFSDHLLPGTFLDIGAYDGVTLSNTRPLYEIGWKGVLIEPRAETFVALEKNYPEDSGCHLVNAGVGPWKTLAQFWECQGDFPSTFEASIERRTHFSDKPYRQIFSVIITMGDLENTFCGIYPEGFSFVNIDAEGYNQYVLQGLYSSHWRPKMVCIEMDPEAQVPYYRTILKKMGLVDQKEIGGNLLAWKPK